MERDLSENLTDVVRRTGGAARDRSRRGAGRASPAGLAAARDLVAILQQMVVQLMAQIWPAVERRLRAKQPNVTAEQVADLRGEHERIFVNDLNDLIRAPAPYARHFSARGTAPAADVLPVAVRAEIAPAGQGQLLDAFTRSRASAGFSI